MVKGAEATEATEADNGQEAGGDVSYEELFDTFVDGEKGDVELNESPDPGDEEEPSEEEEEESDAQESIEDSTEAEGEPSSKDVEGWEKKYRDLQSLTDRRYNQLLQEHRELERRVEAEKETTTQSAPEETFAEFNVDEYVKGLDEADREIFEDNPSLLKIMADVTKKMSIDSASVQKLIAKEMEKRDEAMRQQVAQEQIERDQQELLRRVPNAADILQDNDFLIWKADNEHRVNDILSRSDNNVDAVANVIKYYQSSTVMKRDTETRRKNMTKATSKVPKGASTRNNAMPDDGDYESSFAYFERSSQRR